MLEKIRRGGFWLSWSVLCACHPVSSPAGAARASSSAPATTPESERLAAGQPVAIGSASAAPPPSSAVPSKEAAPPTPLSSAAAATSAKAKGPNAISAGPQQQAAPPNLDACASPFPAPGSDCSRAFPAKALCPARFSDVQAGAYCGIEGRTQPPPACAYPEATCSCEHIPYCGGVTPTLLQQMGMTWVCEAPRLAGACPRAASPGGVCTKAGQDCSYSSCGSSTQCSCVRGKYRCQTQPQATPP